MVTHTLDRQRKGLFLLLLLRWESSEIGADTWLDQLAVVGVLGEQVTVHYYEPDHFASATSVVEVICSSCCLEGVLHS